MRPQYTTKSLCCAHCGQTFSCHPSQVRYGRKYCSHECANAAKREAGLAERYWRHVVKREGCWEWTGPKNALGYPVINKTSNDKFYGHRVAWELCNGPIPAGMMVCHRCDNPTCTNPEHLFLGTQADNMADMRQKGRAHNVAEYCRQHPEEKAIGNHTGIHNGRAKLVPCVVNEIRHLHNAQGISGRELARRFGIGYTQVGRILRHEQWKG